MEREMNQSIEDLKASLSNLRLIKFSRNIALSNANKIRHSVFTGETTWSELGTSEEELASFVKKAEVAELKTGIRCVESGVYPSTINFFDKIKDSVNRGLTTWAELGTSEEKIIEFAAKVKY